MEVAYAEEAKPATGRDRYFNPLVGGIRIQLFFTALGKNFGHNCTLGYTGWLYGTPIIVTAWHCSGWVWGSNIAVSSGNILWYCSDARYYVDYINRYVVAKCLVKTSIQVRKADSGGPVYVPGKFIGLNSIEVWAYGVVSSYRDLAGISITSLVSTLDSSPWGVKYT